MSAGRALIIAVSGFLIVFLMLCLLWFIIVLINKVTDSIGAKTAKEEPVKAETSTVEVPAETGTQEAVYGGEIALYDVDEKTAACLMAIVSDETKIPLNQLIFKSIKALD